MELRPALLAPQLDPAAVELLARLGDEIIDYLDTNKDYSLLIEQFNQITSRVYDISDFDAAAGAMDMEEFAKLALTPDPPYIADLTREEQLELIHRVAFSGCGAYEDYQTGYWYELLRRHFGMPHLPLGDCSTPEEVLQKALCYKPIAL